MNERVSVCMATYNGSAYIRDQLRTILEELAPTDEVVIVDDSSTDDTVSIIVAVDDPRIRLIQQESNQGYVRTFERALKEAEGDVLLLSDQDDEWIPGRRDLLVRAAMGSGIAASNLVLLESGESLRSPLTGKPWRLQVEDSGRRLRNEFLILIGDIPYFGCTMAVRKDVLSRITPFPPFLTESHDLWIATVANRHGLMTHVSPPTLRRRVHASNASTPKPRALSKVLRARWMLWKAYLVASRR
ncbi:glycosyltransferase family 2 protein [Microbacterium yannicii]|uniref:Glycosyltransferase family 2 protein n=1 Tax=Microbacterium yannicii TaxID=671622 RepID=A0ABP9MKD1_9MICO|nr:glycosyltransferase [Microbacterium yannicii]MCO5953388.1 glycosyltransferase [Microbacterium yannicii]